MWHFFIGGNQRRCETDACKRRSSLSTPVWGPCCAALTVMKASRGDSRPRSVFRIRRWRSPPTSRRTRCSTPCQRIERELGRNRAAEAVEKGRYRGSVTCSRPIDIDILFYDDEVIGDERAHDSRIRCLAEREFVAGAAVRRYMRQRRASRDGSYRRRDARRAPKQIERV